MSRTSGDQYKLANGELVTMAPGDKPNGEAILWNGYNYDDQHWIIKGKPVDHARPFRYSEHIKPGSLMP